MTNNNFARPTEADRRRAEELRQQAVTLWIAKVASVLVVVTVVVIAAMLIRIHF